MVEIRVEQFKNFSEAAEDAVGTSMSGVGGITVIYQDDSDIILISGSTDHAALSNLTYASAGHTGFAPTSHAVNASTYGYGTATNAGHLRIGTGLSVTTGTASVSYGSTGTTACVGNDSRLSDARTPTSHNNSYHSEIYITTTGVTYEALSGNSDIGTGSTQVAQGDHTHDSRYYTESETDVISGALNTKLDTHKSSSDHDSRYYTESEVNTISGAINTNLNTHISNRTNVHGLTVSAGKTLTVSNTLTLTATDSSTLAIGTGGTLGTAAYTASTAYATSAQGVTNGNSHDHSGGDGAQIDHGGLGGLSDDDHSQYLNTARGDARYYTESETDVISGALNTKLDTHKSSADHDSRYYIESEVDTISGAINTNLNTHISDRTDIHGLTVATGKTLTANNTLTLTATDGSTLAIGTGGTLGTAAYTASTAYAPAASGVLNGNSHDHNGGDGAQIVYSTLGSIPSTFAPSSHNNTAHSETYITSAGVTYENLSANGDIGTTANTVASGAHTHSQLHDRSHTITSTSDHTAGNWKVLYSNGSGQITELTLGAAGTVLYANGATSAPTFTAIIGASTDNKLARYNSTNAIQGATGASSLDDSDNLVIAGSIKTTGTSKVQAAFYAGSTDPTNVDRLNYDGYFYATRVYNAVYNDYADYQDLDDDLVFGKCYYDTKSGAKICNDRCQKSVIGVASNTYGHAVGNINKGVPIAIAGWVLAYVDKEYEIGTPLTNDDNGNLTEITKEEKLNYPERIVAIYKKPEISEYWGPQQVLVDGRHWVKIK